MDLPKAYDAKTTEPKWITQWTENERFRANPHSEKKPYCIVIPPPNVTGVLHMGHALVNTLQDILIRWKRMQGCEVLWVPGTDHAGISTQTVVEKKLFRETGKKRSDFTRDEFLDHVWKWKEENEHIILSQLKALGASCDWSRTRFTMDSGNNAAVRTIFKKLYDQNYIYRGDYLVNWDPIAQTAIADDEVEYEDRDSFLWTLKYPIKGENGFITLATTRPETMLGDTAVAVNPKDERYKSLVGKMILHPLTGREIPIIADPFVDPEFGTGAVKITPAHDPNDYEMGIRHNLPFINIMTKDGRINENGGEFQSLFMMEARSRVIEALKNLQLVEKIEPHKNRVGISYRSKAVIEPFISKQWFVRMDAFKPKLESCVKDKRCALIPESWENTYFHWINNLRDWCISRQLWWGHRIPIWYNKNDPEQIICYDGEGSPPGIDESEWVQDSDVLDTWFSSALWPFAALGWPENTPELKKFYPNAVLVTGHDILFFWVARMLMMGEYAMEKTPFPETFLHGLIFGKSYWKVNPDGGISYLSDEEKADYDKGKALPQGVYSRWEKMSKSKGNVINPLDIIDEYGTDALRMTMCSSGARAREIDLDVRKFEEYRNFANKIWNGSRFVFMQIEDLPNLSEGIDKSLLDLEDKWILSLLNSTIKNVNHALENYEFDQALSNAYDFFWKDFCSYYVEISKPVLFGKKGTPDARKNKQKILVVILEAALRLMHPMIPFITEELFSLLKQKFPNAVESEDPYTNQLAKALQSDLCALAPYPQVIDETDINKEAENAFKDVENIIYTIRNIRGEMKLSPGDQPPIYIEGKPHDPLFQISEENKNIIESLIKTSGIHHVNELPELPFLSFGAIGSLKIAIPLPKEYEMKEKERLAKEKEKTLANLQRLEAQLANQDFVSRAPAALVEKNKMQLQRLKEELSQIEKKLT